MEKFKNTKPKFLMDAHDYYKYSIDPQMNFDKVEITLSHLFRFPSPVINQRTYGQSLYEFLISKDTAPVKVMEIGGGLGNTMKSFLEADRNAGGMIKACVMLDVSPALSVCQREELQDISEVNFDFVNHDCEGISNVIENWDGLIVCNGMIADLDTCLVEPGDNLSKLLRNDEVIQEFVRTEDRHESYYLHFGTLRFLHSLRKIISDQSTLLISEYRASPINQPSWFDNHYECGIDFSQITRFAESLGFGVEEFDVSEVIGFDIDTEFLSMDFFTAKDAMAIECPVSMKLWSLDDGFPVKAYSREMVEAKLENELPKDETSKIMEQLDGYFFPIDADGFDRKNPTTWHYRYLILRPSSKRDDEALADFLSDVFRHGFGLPDDVAQKLTSEFSSQRKMDISFAPHLIDMLKEAISSFALDLVKMGGGSSCRNCI